MGRTELQRRICARHEKDYPCSCGMGNLYRFVEPVVLLLLKEKGESYGYDLLESLHKHALTDAAIEKGALYRTLRQLELNGYVRSEWETEKTGPARRVYKLTSEGTHHLAEWAAVLEHLSKSMNRFVRSARGSGRKLANTKRESA
jgi:PadR family transcriptional regulator PadR